MSIKDLFQRKRIMQLPKSVADRIAAGEVVDRPLSIVKELVENSVDAKADSIVIEIKNGGKSYIRITDNGIGIPSQDVETAFFRHATNKIVTDSDLFEIETLGFRGEALASIASVTRTQMITKTPEESVGVKITIEGGKVNEKIPVGASDGTTIIVTDLFYNTPAREKFMKKDSVESALIIDFISKLTLAYPKIRFKLINNDKILFATNGKGNVLENIFTIFGKEIASNLLEFDKSEGDLNVKGFISNPVYTKSTKKSQFFFVNGRYISSRTLEEGVRQGYGDKLPEGRQPVAFVFLTISPDSIDVNIHPNKKEIRFHNPAMVKEFVRKSVLECLNSREGVGNIPVDSILKKNSLDKISENNDYSGSNIFVKKDEGDEERLEQGELKIETEFNAMPKSDHSGLNIGFKPKSNTKMNTKPSYKASPGKANSKAKSWVNPEFVDIINLSETSENDINSEVVFNNEESFKEKITAQPKPQISDISEPSASIIYETKDESSAVEEDEAAPIVKSEHKTSMVPTLETRRTKFDLSTLEVMGVFFNTYIIAYDSKTLYMIDQHAAHERVFYEKFLNEFTREMPSPQMIMVPMIKELPFYAQEEGGSWMEFLERSGFIIEPFGGRNYIIKGIPSYMDLAQGERFLDDYLENITRSTDFTDQRTLDRIIMKSCKSAVKAHDKLSREEVNALLRDLSMTRNPYSCPHGRPVIIKMTDSDIERMFKRA